MTDHPSWPLIVEQTPEMLQEMYNPLESGHLLPFRLLTIEDFPESHILVVGSTRQPMTHVIHFTERLYGHLWEQDPDQMPEESLEEFSVKVDVLVAEVLQQESDEEIDPPDCCGGSGVIDLEDENGPRYVRCPCGAYERGGL